MDAFVDGNKVFTGLYFQYAIMKYNFECFSEVTFLMLHTIVCSIKNITSEKHSELLHTGNTIQ